MFGAMPPGPGNCRAQQWLCRLPRRSSRSVHLNSTFRGHWRESRNSQDHRSRRDRNAVGRGGDEERRGNGLGPRGQGEQSASEAGYDASQSISRMVYTASYILAFGIVYTAVFVAQSLPQENPVMRGFRVGGQAAMDKLSAS
jgi:hypothetical protein